MNPEPLIEVLPYDGFENSLQAGGVPLNVASDLYR